MLAEIESTLNSRPLTIDFEEIGKEPLTPFHYCMVGNYPACLQELSMKMILIRIGFQSVLVI